MTKHIHVHLHRTGDVEGIKTKKSSGGVTTWGGADPKGIMPKLIKDAGTSEGARKAAQTRKSHGRAKAEPMPTRVDPSKGDWFRRKGGKMVWVPHK